VDHPPTARCATVTHLRYGTASPWQPPTTLMSHHGREFRTGKRHSHFASQRLLTCELCLTWHWMLLCLLQVI